MKNLILALSLMICTTAWAGKGAEIIKKYGESEIVTNLVKSVESEYGVTCGKSNQGGIFPTVFGSVWYSTYCVKLGAMIKLKINSSFKNNDEPDFTYERYKLKVIAGQPLLGEEEIFYLDTNASDPFVTAFKKSELVRSFRHFVEDQHKMVCEDGKAHKRNDKYFFNAKCKSDAGSLTIKLKSNVIVIGDDTFKFKLKNYKVIF